MTQLLLRNCLQLRLLSENKPLITDFEECDSNPCQNGGRCLDGHGEHWYNCTCEPGYNGTDCEQGKFITREPVFHDTYY